MIKLYMNFTVITTNCPLKNPRNYQHYYCPPTTQNQDNTTTNSPRRTDNQIKLQHKYKNKTQDHIEFFLHPFILPLTNSLIRGLHQLEGNPRGEGLHLGGEELGEGLGFDGEEGWRLQMGGGGRE
jgi:hypothetical protein